MYKIMNFFKNDLCRNILFSVLVLLFYMIMMVYASMFVDWGAFFEVIMISPVFLISIYLLQKNGLNNIFELNSNMKKCKEAYISKGFSAYDWYTLRFLGPIWWVGSWSIFYFSEWKSPWILTVGLLGWCLFFKLQTMRERKWCSEVMEVNDRFINIKILQFIILYTIPLYLINLYGSSLSKSFSIGILCGCVMVWYGCIFPMWIYLQAGERMGFFSDCKWWMLSDYHLQVNRSEDNVNRSREIHAMETSVMVLVVLVMSVLFSNQYS